MNEPEGDEAAPPNRIREWRMRRGLSQAELGGKIGVGNQQISRLESGARRLTVDWMVKVAAALEVEPWQLMRAEPEGAMEQERAALHLFERLPAEQKDHVLRLMRWLAESGGRTQ